MPSLGLSQVQLGLDFEYRKYHIEVGGRYVLGLAEGEKSIEQTANIEHIRL